MTLQQLLGEASRQSYSPPTFCRVESWCAGAAYQSSFRPNCTCREVVAVLVMTPAVGEIPDGVKATSFGILKFARFNKLKISARNCRFSRSLIFVSFIVEKSHVASPGPRSVFLPRLP